MKIFFLLLFFTLTLSASQKLKVFILHSYSQEYRWTKEQHNSFIETLQNTPNNFDFYSEYLDTKRIDFTQKYQAEFLSYLEKKYSTLRPDIIYVSDDNALVFMHNNYKKLYGEESTIPVFFSGVNNLKIDDFLDTKIYRGIFEFKEIRPNIELIKQFSPQTRDVYIVGDDSNTYQAIKADIQMQEGYFSNLKFHYISDVYISKLIAKMPQKERSFVLLSTIGSLKDEDNTTLSVKDAIERLSALQNITILTMEDGYMYKGVIGGYVTSAKNQGKASAELLLKYLKKQNFKNVDSIKYDSSIYIFDSQELIKARVLLSEYIRRVSTIINGDEDFLQKNGHTLLEVLLGVTIFVVVLFITLYALERKKVEVLYKRLKSHKSVESKINFYQMLTHALLVDSNRAYWSIDMETQELHLSRELIEVLDIDMAIYKDDRDLLSYFIHFNDKNYFDEKFNKVKISHEKEQFHHRMLNSHNRVFNVEHLIYFDENSQTLIGIIRVEK